MALIIPSLDQIRAAILRDQVNLNPNVDTSPDSDTYIRATGDAGAIHGLYQYASWGVNQFFPDTADPENLVRHASARGITQLPATNAAGTMKLTGNVGAAVPIGTVAQVNGVQYQTKVAGVIGDDGSVSVAAAALIAGPAGNLANMTAGTLLAAPDGIDANVVFTEMGGGVAAESMASLLARLLDRLRQPPAGGNKFDYVSWAKEVPGVTEAYVYPKRRGLGTVDVAVLSNGVPATAQLRADVLAHIEEKAPPHGDTMILSPQDVMVAVTAVIALAPGADLDTVTTAIQKALQAYFATLKPGDTAIRSRIQTIIGEVVGVADYNVTAPAANVATLVDADHIERAALGAVTIGI
ncbi:putative phage protein gp47/JayE [Paucimonas lemoignei]|uniref:Putative phage protein gp47/JayE n=1 Tax=Paucimonas lemoignei TaxID=29443 RepID=A0A4R3HZ09_PAULE|nr:baseplate J/gp47 family protein [Paucimonas lemoignei]TCS38472.1 putative phage protein gp47/JayE [Paucimonas lemoignei]